MDFAVIQAGRLAEKQKNLSKEEALSAVRYGADKVFRAENVDITDEEIETMIANAKNLTAEREAKMAAGVEDKAKRDLLDFSDANVNFQVRAPATCPSYYLLEQKNCKLALTDVHLCDSCVRSPTGVRRG